MKGDMKMKGKVLVTGGAGFIGSFLVEALMARDYEVTIFDLDTPTHTKSARFIKGDITNRNAVDKAVRGHNAVMHFAGMLGTHETVEHAYEAARINILGALNVYDAALKYSARVYDVTKPNYWRNPYTITKVAAEEFGLMYRDEFNLSVILLRYFNVFGPRQKTEIYQKAVPTFILQALRNQPICIYGDGTQGTDHIFVEDAVEATIKVFESGKNFPLAVEIGSGEEITVNDIAKEIIRLTRSKSRIKHIPMRRGETEHTRIKADIKFLETIGFKPMFSFEKGLKKTIEFYKKNI